MKKALIDQIREDQGVTTAEAERIVAIVFTSLWTALGRVDRVRVPGFGTFNRKLRDTRNVRNPRTGETSVKAAHHVITFKEAKPAK